MLIYGRKKMNKDILPEDFYKKNLFYDCGDKSMKARLGFLPSSLWKPDATITKFLKELINDKSQARETLNSNRSDRRHGVNNGKCSVFNPQLAQMILAAYAPMNGKIYDPFGGGGTRGYIATKMGYDYTGVEIREEEYNRVLAQMKEWNLNFKFILADSVKYRPNESFDFIYTCPPYYDLEVYSDMEEDLSNAPSYMQYLNMLQKVLNNCYDVLKKDSFAVFLVGNFRNKKGELEHLNGDLITKAKEVGFKLWDELIWMGASNVALTRCGKFEKNRKSVRMHEYIIILKK